MRDDLIVNAHNALINLEARLFDQRVVADPRVEHYTIETRSPRARLIDRVEHLGGVAHIKTVIRDVELTTRTGRALAQAHRRGARDKMSVAPASLSA